MKPDTVTAMRGLITEVRNTMPFNLPAAALCAGPCRGCPKKLLEYLDQELEDWEQRLDNGEKPSLGDVSKFAKTCRRIHQALAANQLVEPR
ncbi:hypothetical protein Q2E61_04045 [Microbulbifer thermotolerans]|uniref:hypothetical protein n=1 Tax=Microbulbifer thermotolerans TaxID=252514 RepID=UPI002673257E|nr:hypothetical protein [Microbulbifer thermotolerans]WKT61368.1 hypothetical protein Q2E61_04045 [Microbulbifer thermotolerans]